MPYLRYVAVGIVLGGAPLWAQAPEVADARTDANELDAFMARVLERREQNWITLHQYILDERETLELTGPDGARLQGFSREYAWFVRDGYLIRSPVRFDGVPIDEAERRAFEENWLRQERRRVNRTGRPPARRSRRGSYENIMLTIERDWGARIDESLGRRLAEDAEGRGDDFAAIVAGTDQIVTDLGGVTGVGFGSTVARTRDAFVLIETGRLTDAEGAAVVAALLPRLARALPASGDADAEDAIDGFVELGELAARFGLAGAPLADGLEAAATALRETGWPEAARTMARAAAAVTATTGSAEADSGELSLSSGLQPRFVSESFFLDFQFEPGNYYFAGRDRIDGRDVVVIEYYPEQLFSDEAATVDSNDREDRIEAGFDKTSLVTLWIDPELHQIVKFTFDNVGFDFMPGRWLLRLDDLTASMVMSQPFEGIWLPQSLALNGQISLAVGTYRVTYRRSFDDYRQAEVGARIRSYRTPETEPRE